MIAGLLVGLALAGEPTVAAGVRYRWTSWLDSRNSEIVLDDPATTTATGLDMFEGPFPTAAWDFPASWYQIVDVQARLGKRLRLKLLLDNDPTFRQVLRAAGEVGWDGMVMRLELGSLPGEVRVTNDPDDEFLVGEATTDNQYRLISFGGYIAPGVVSGGAWLHWEHPAAWQTRVHETLEPAGMVVDPATRFDIVGVYLDLKLLDALLMRERYAGPGWVHQGPRGGAAFGIEGTLIFGLFRSQVDPAIYDTVAESMGLRAVPVGEGGLGTTGGQALAGAVSRNVGRSGSVGLTGGLEWRPHMMYGGPSSNEAIRDFEPAPDEVLLVPDAFLEFGLQVEVLWGPYFGVAGTF